MNINCLSTQLPSYLNIALESYANKVSSLKEARGCTNAFTTNSWERLAPLVSPKTRYRREQRVHMTAISHLLHSKRGNVDIFRDLGPDIEILTDLAEDILVAIGGRGQETASGICTKGIAMLTLAESSQSFSQSQSSSASSMITPAERASGSGSAMVSQSKLELPRTRSYFITQRTPSRSTSHPRQPSRVPIANRTQP